MNAPFMLASFVGLKAVPNLGLTELGLIDCKMQGLMDIVLSDNIAEQDGSVLSIRTRSIFVVVVQAMQTMSIG
jgi:hypothetical protein